MIENTFFRVLGPFSIGTILGLLVVYFAMYLPSKRVFKKLKEDGKKESEKKLNKNPEKPVKSEGRSNLYFNGMVEFKENLDKNTYSVSLTEMGDSRLSSLGTAEEAIISLISFVDGFNFDIDLHVSDKRLYTYFEKAAAFRWYVVHTANRIAELLLEDKKVKGEKNNALKTLDTQESCL